MSGERANKNNPAQNDQTSGSARNQGGSPLHDSNLHHDSSETFEGIPYLQRREYIAYLQRTLGNDAVGYLWQTGQLQRRLKVDPEKTPGYTGVPGKTEQPDRKPKQPAKNANLQLQRTPNSKENPDQPRLHKTKGKDTLWDLSKRYYGDATKFDYIFYANRDKIKKPDQLPIGIEIIIPYTKTISQRELSKNPDDDFYVDHFKFLIKAKSYAIIQNQKQYVETLKEQYTGKNRFFMIEQLIKIKETDDKLARKESDYRSALRNFNTPKGMGALYLTADFFDAVKNVQEKLNVVQALRLQLITAYPALKILRGETLENSIEKIKEQLVTGFDEMIKDLDQAEKMITEEDINLNKLSPVIQAVLKQEKITPEKAKAGDAKSTIILEWLDDQDFKETAISIGGVILSLGLLIAASLSGGTLAPVCLSVASAIVSTGTSAYDLEIAHDVYQVSKAGEGNLTGIENAKFNMIMGVAALALDVIGVGKAVKAGLLSRAAKLQKITIASKAMGKPLFAKAETAGVMSKILNLPAKEFDLALDILQKNSLHCIQEHHWINEVLADHRLFKRYNISLHEDWNKNFLVGHMGRHPTRYMDENRQFLQDLFRLAEKKNMNRKDVIMKLKEQADLIRKSVQNSPSSLYQNLDKPVIVLE